ncbi:PREDICTED: G-type lectin S-receptor-like serine/threonine-protein kinase SD1-1 [Ipomoea nil]|uniref:G-type lectin S-receptor-like serine/threonine-protein kinase SD1-1 n=1 Tax=Ipomoea nil TaxID=35883 RepID=UPI0009012FE7|nr:PREDICTED: G-type lectin S-receptor-like serine/threonine-protein kinase SD1-1 [Ipomoea nil]
MSLQECEQVCFRNCSCMAYSTLNISNGGSGCLIWYGDLVDMRPVQNGQDMFIRLAASEMPGLKAEPHHSTSFRRKIKILALCLSLLVVIVLAGVYLFLYFCKRKRKEQKLELEQELELPIFGWSTISRATNNFSKMNKLGQGGFGAVYKGALDGGEEIAVKRLSKNSKQGLQEFKNELICIVKLQHRNLVKLLGCCISGEEKMLIYEYMYNKSLDFFIFDFGLARSIVGNAMGDNTKRVAGTDGYMSPEYAGHGIFSVKSDVFSFGISVLEIVSGRRNNECNNSSSGPWNAWVWEDEIKQWVSYRSQPADICGTYGLCGGNGVCDIQQFHGCMDSSNIQISNCQIQTSLGIMNL